MEEIGGYFELELSKRKEYHNKALKLNTGKNCLEYILRAREYKKIYIPYYTCEIILELIKKLDLNYEFYSIDINLDPLFSKEIEHDEAFLYTNYFGIKDATVLKLTLKYKNLIIDNAQAFFSDPIKGIDTFYSARKFFGVPDGAYLFTDAPLLKTKILRDKSMRRMQHLLKRIELNAEAGFNDFKQNDQLLSCQPIKRMSRLTHNLLMNIDYKKIHNTRQNNFLFLHERLKNWNNLSIETTSVGAPMVYPFLTEKMDLRQILIDNKIFVARYWDNVLNWVNEESIENKLVKNLVSLPID